jgi:hypothetical protein
MNSIALELSRPPLYLFSVEDPSLLHRSLSVSFVPRKKYSPCVFDHANEDFRHFQCVCITIESAEQTLHEHPLGF